MVIGGLDVGTTGCKIALYDETGTNLHTYYQEYNVTRNGGEHEISFFEVKEGVLELLRQAVSQHRVEALGVTSFGESFVMVDEDDEILAPAMLYTDPRGEEECEELCRTLGEERLTLLTGVKPHQMYSIAKMMWLKRHKPQLFGQCKRMLLGEDFIVYTLTGNAQIDYSLAARTAAFDVEKKVWAEEIFQAAGIDVSLMSNPVSAGSIAGYIKPELMEALNIDYPIAVVNGCHDQVAAMIGSGVFEKEQAMDGTGTVECIPVILEEKPKDLKLYAGGYSVVPFLDGKYACYALSFTGGATLKWFRDNFAEQECQTARIEGSSVYDMLNQKMPKEPSGILVLPHFAGAATPYMDTESKAVMVGITLETTKFDIYRALMEGTSYEMLLNFNILREFTGELRGIRATGGGAKSDEWLQIKADILNMEVTALSCEEVGAAGTAALTGVAMGIYTGLKEAVETMAPVRKVFYPDENYAATYRNSFNKYKNLYSAIKSL